MRFVIAANIEDSHTTGMGRQMYGLGGALVRAGHRVGYVFQSTLPRTLNGPWTRLEFPWRLAAHLRSIARTSGPVTAILHEPTAWVSAVMPAAARVRTVAMVHNCEPKAWGVVTSTAGRLGRNIPLSSHILWPLTELSQAVLSLRLSSTVLCLSSEDARYMVERLRVDARRVARIDNGLEPDFLDLPLQASRDRDLLFVGSWLSFKGIRFLADALALLEERGVANGVTLTLAGTSSDEETILRDLPVAWRARTIVLPKVAAEDLVELYRRHRIFVLPSVTEGIPLSLLEAMACGLCPVVSSVGGVMDVVTHGVDAVMVPPMDGAQLAAELERLLLNPGTVEQVALQAHARAQSMSWDHVARQVLNALGRPQVAPS